MLHFSFIQKFHHVRIFLGPGDCAQSRTICLPKPAQLSFFPAPCQKACNDVLITFIVQRNTHNNRYFMFTSENEQFHLLGPFSLNALVKKISEIYRQDECINDGKRHFSYSLLCSSALSNEERKSIVRKFKSNQRKREMYNKYNDHYLQLEPAKKKQRYSF